MKTNKTISLDDDLLEPLKSVENASALICRLLRGHFKYDQGNKDVLIETQKEMSRQIENIQNKYQEITGKISTIDNEEEAIKGIAIEVKDKKADRIQRKAKGLMDLYVVTEEEAIELVTNWDSMKYPNFYTLVKEKGYKKRKE